MASSGSFVAAMDTHTPKQLGENGHAEYTWSHDLKEKIVQFYFQLVRATSVEDSMQLSHMLDDFIVKLKQSKEDRSIKHVPEKLELLRSLYKLIGHTRDITSGKGEKTLTYMQIYTWYLHYPNLAKYAFRSLVHYINDDYSIETSQHQYGSWADVKYFCKYVKDRSGNSNHELINYAVELIINQLKIDYQKYVENRPISLAARWCPKEKQKQFNWIFKKISNALFPYSDTAANSLSFNKAQKKSFMDMRHTYLVPLNKYLDTTQIKMCDARGKWSEINWNSVTSKTMKNNKNAWQNINKNGSVRYEDNEDRIQCAINYNKHVEDAAEGKNNAKIHGKVLNTYELVKDVFTCNGNDTDVKRINLQWEDSGKKIADNLGNIIAMADTSGSMTSDECVPFYNALGLSIRVSEKSNPAFRDRVLQFSTTAKWFNLSGYKTFYEKVNHMKSHINCMSTNFVGAMKLILDAVIEAELHPRDVEDMVLVVFSDMQLNSGGYGATWDDTMYDTIVNMYEAAGLRSKYKRPYKPPHICFWNLRKTNGFPCSSKMKNVTMISGYSDALLNSFLEKGGSALKEFTGYDMFADIINNSRYNMLSHYFNDYFMPL